MSGFEWSAAAGEQIDRMAVHELVQRERVARDMMQWDELAAYYTPESLVDISWFCGTGAEFARASAKMAAGGLRSFHQMGPSISRIRGRRAIASTGCAVHLLRKIGDVDVDVIGHTRLYARAEKHNAGWLLAGFRAIYVQDMIMPLAPNQHVPLEEAELGQYRESYRHLSYLLALAGHPPRQNLAGTDRPETVKPLLDAEEAWLNEAV